MDDSLPGVDELVVMNVEDLLAFADAVEDLRLLAGELELILDILRRVLPLLDTAVLILGLS